MITFLLVIHVMIACAIIAIILIQKPEGGSQLLSGQNIKSLFSSTQGNILTKATIILGALFFVLSITIGMVSVRKVSKTSVDIDKIENLSKQAPAVANPVAPSKPTAPLVQ